MQNKLTIITILTLAHFSSLAQFHHGLLAGLNLSNIQSQTTHQPEAGTGLHLGWYSEVQFKDRISLLSSIVLSDKGFNKDHIRRHFYYVMLPVIFRYKVWNRLSVEAGPGIGYLLHDNAVYNEKWGPAPYEINRDIWQKRVDFQLAAGIHYNVSKRFGVMLRYEHGLSNLVGNAEVQFRTIGDSDPLYKEDPITYRDLDIKDSNRNIQLTVSYAFKRNKAD